MRYDFDTVVDRKGTDCLKWDYASRILGSPPDAVPLWVADMDFSCAAPIVAALEKRARQGVFGYSMPGSCYYDAVTGWFSRRFGWEIQTKSIHLAPGVVPAIVILLYALTKEGDGVVIQEPVYNPFRACIEAAGRAVVNNPLVLHNGKYCIDYKGLEECFAKGGAKGLLFCSPHNPAGRVWSEEELKRVGEVCGKYGAWIISDEIHCDLTRNGRRHYPLETVCPDMREAIVTCTSPSKGFNLAGLMMSNIIINNREAAHRYHHEIVKKLHMESISPFAIDATIAAYTEGEEWLEQMNAYVDGNVAFTQEVLARDLPKARMVDCEGTYLLWVDFSAYFADGKEMREFMKNRAKVALNDGAIYGVGGEPFERINAACPRAILAECLRRIAGALSAR